MNHSSSDRLGLEFITALGLPPPKFVAMAARLGCRRIGLAPAPIVGSAGWTLRGNRPLLIETRRALTDHGVSLSLGEGFLIMPDRDMAAAAADVEVLAELGAAVLNVCMLESDRERGIDQFGALADMADRHGLPVSVEFMPGTPVGTLAEARRFLEEAKVSNAGVLVDAMHFFASGGVVAELAAAPPGLVLYAQLCDARQPGLYSSYFADARCNRPAPGEGVLPLADFVAALPANCPIGLEVPMMDKAGSGGSPEAFLPSCIDAARALMSR